MMMLVHQFPFPSSPLSSHAPNEFPLCRISFPLHPHVFWFWHCSQSPRGEPVIQGILVCNAALQCICKRPFHFSVASNWIGRHGLGREALQGSWWVDSLAIRFLRFARFWPQISYSQSFQRESGQQQVPRLIRQECWTEISAHHKPLISGLAENAKKNTNKNTKIYIQRKASILLHIFCIFRSGQQIMFCPVNVVHLRSIFLGWCGMMVWPVEHSAGRNFIIDPTVPFLFIMVQKPRMNQLVGFQVDRFPARALWCIPDWNLLINFGKISPL